MADTPVPEPPALDPVAFWQHGELPDPADPASSPEPAWGLHTVARPEITVDGRNLADVLTPVYRALTEPS